MSQPRPTQLSALTSARFAAAFIVLLTHCNYAVHLPGWLAPVAAQGPAAVGFFFILSGFILTYNYHEAFAERVSRAAFRRFYQARFARIFPLQVLALLGFTAITAAIAPALLRDPARWGSWAIDFAMLQSLVPTQHTIQDWNAPAWSLSCEMAFYLAFPFLLAAGLGRASRDRHALAWLAAVWLGGVGGSLAVMGLLNHLWGSVGAYYFAFSPFSRGWEFLLGCVAARWFLVAREQPDGHPVYRRLFGSVAARDAVGVGAIALMLALAFSGVPAGELGYLAGLLKQFPLFAPCSVALVLALASGPTSASRLLDRRFCVHLGEASYALYLFHDLPLRLLGHAIYSHREILAFGYLWLALIVLLTVALSSWLFRHVETPARKWLRSSFEARSAARVKEPVPGL